LRGEFLAVGAGLVRAATPRALPPSNTPSARNCWSCSSRSRRARREQQSFGTPRGWAVPGNSAPSRARPPRLGVEVSPIDARDTDGIERAVSAFANVAYGCL